MNDSDKVFIEEIRALRRDVTEGYLRIDEKQDTMNARLVAIETKFKLIVPFVTLFITTAYDFIKRKFIH